MPSVEGVVPREGVVHTKIAAAGQICFLTLVTRQEEVEYPRRVTPYWYRYRCSGTISTAKKSNILTNELYLLETVSGCPFFKGFS